MTLQIDDIDRRILRALQRDGGLSQRDLAEQVGVSQNACWRRLQNLKGTGIIKGQTVRLDRARLGLGLTVFVLMRTRHHSRDWLDKFRAVVTRIPDVIDFCRIAGEYDYMLKIVTEDMNAYDQIYQRIIEQVELDAVTSYMAMESIADQRSLPV